MYIKTIEEFIRDVRNDFEHAVIRVLEENRDIRDDDKERLSWLDSLPRIAQILERLPKTTRLYGEIVLEAQFAAEEKRADVVLVGEKAGRQVMLLIENKRWSWLGSYRPLGTSSVWDPHRKRMIDHPSHQVLHYEETLRYTNRYVQDHQTEIHALVYLQNGNLLEKTHGWGPFDNRYEAYLEKAPIFIGEEEDEMAAYIGERIAGGVPGTAAKIYGSEIRYSEEYREILGNLFGNPDRLRGILDDCQTALFDEIAYELNHGTEKTVYIIEGKTGTGKSFLAAALLSYLYQNAEKPNVSIRYVEKNRDPRKMLHQQWKIPYQVMMASTALMNRTVAYDCLICDEAHRMLEQVCPGEDEGNCIERFLELGRISVFFYDEKQSVHVADYVTKERIRKIAAEKGIGPERIIERELLYQHRCRSAGHFLEAVEQILDHPEKRLNGLRRFWGEETYQVMLVDDTDRLFSLIREKNESRGTESTSRVLAGKGRSYGEDWIWDYHNTDYEAEKTIAPLWDSAEKKYTWNFARYGADRTFASDERSVELAGCIDTGQGLGFEYVGVLIAPDLIYNKETMRVEVSLDGHHQADPHTGGKAMNRYDREEIVRIIKNTYRVLLSRGEKGCYIYCCDKALQEYLGQIFPRERTANGAGLGRE